MTWINNKRVLWREKLGSETSLKRLSSYVAANWKSFFLLLIDIRCFQLLQVSPQLFDLALLDVSMLDIFHEHSGNGHVYKADKKILRISQASFQRTTTFDEVKIPR